MQRGQHAQQGPQLRPPKPRTTDDDASSAAVGHLGVRRGRVQVLRVGHQQRAGLRGQRRERVRRKSGWREALLWGSRPEHARRGPGGRARAAAGRTGQTAASRRPHAAHARRRGAHAAPQQGRSRAAGGPCAALPRVRRGAAARNGSAEAARTTAARRSGGSERQRACKGKVSGPEAAHAVSCAPARPGKQRPGASRRAAEAHTRRSGLPQRRRGATRPRRHAKAGQLSVQGGCGAHQPAAAPCRSRS